MKLIDSRYMFCNTPLRPVAVVAVEGGVQDWAAYAAGLDTFGEPRDDILELVYHHGVKLTEEQARGFFPGIALEYRR